MHNIIDRELSLYTLGFESKESTESNITAGYSDSPCPSCHRCLLSQLHISHVMEPPAYPQCAAQGQPREYHKLISPGTTALSCASSHLPPQITHHVRNRHSHIVSLCYLAVCVVPEEDSAVSGGCVDLYVHTDREHRMLAVHFQESADRAQVTKWEM